MFNKNQLLKLDIVLLISLPVLAILISLLIKANFLTSILLFFGLSSFYFSYRTIHAIKKTVIFSGILSIPLMLIIDYLAVLDKSWFVPTTLFPFKILGLVVVEGFILAFLLTYNVIIFYEHFLDKGKHKVVASNMKYLVFGIFVALLLFFITYFTKLELLHFKYFYLVLGLILVVLPSITALSLFPKLLFRYVITGAYFSIVLFLFEFTGLQLGQWEFPGEHFIGFISLFGYTFPIEELIFWIILSSIAILSFFELFDRERNKNSKKLI